jgi:hypothetical protein
MPSVRSTTVNPLHSRSPRINGARSRLRRPPPTELTSRRASCGRSYFPCLVQSTCVRSDGRAEQASRYAHIKMMSSRRKVSDCFPGTPDSSSLRLTPAIAPSHLLCNPGSIHIGAYGTERYTRFRIPHLSRQECRDESCRHMRERVSSLLPADSLNCLSNLVIEVAFQDSLQKSASVRKVPIQGSNRDACPQRHPGRGQPLFPHAEQNLNGRFKNSVHASSRTCLNRRFAGLQECL